MKKVNYIILLLALIFGKLSSQFSLDKKELISQLSSQTNVINNNNFDVLHYKLDAILGMEDNSFSGNMEMKILITALSDSITLNALGLVFTSLKVDNINATYQMYTNREIFTVYLPRTYTQSETLSMSISYYIDQSSLSLPFNRKGYYWFKKDLDSKIEENIGYTMSEPFDARLWMPCFDDPSDKATCEINITVPVGYQAGSNGKLVGVIENPNNTITYKWREDFPITTYLMVISASKYSVFKQYYKKVTNPSDSIEIVNYIWKVDSAGPTWNAVQAFSKVPWMMEVFSTIFGEYPFVKYGHAVAYPFYYGGMEHQTLSTIHRGWISVNAYPFYDDYIAHELAHQWWGNLVTCRTFKDIWLNEGFATYSEMLWREFAFGTQSRNELLNRYTRFTDPSWQYAIYDPQSQGINIFTSNVYHKAGWVLHMLRNLVGDSMFFSILMNYRNTHLYGTATTADFINVVNSTTQNDYSWFFNQWIYGKGWLKIVYETTYDDNSKNFALSVAQVQDNSWPTYKFPLELKFYFDNRDTTITIWDSLRVQVFLFNFASRPDSMIVDPYKKLLKQIVAQPVLVETEYAQNFYLHQNFPNPFNSSTEIKFQLMSDGNVKLAVYDLLGNEIQVLVDEFKQAGWYNIQFDASNLPSGIYYYRLQTLSQGIRKYPIETKTKSSKVRKMVLIK